jgi:hypothetical protein
MGGGTRQQQLQCQPTSVAIQLAIQQAELKARQVFLNAVVDLVEVAEATHNTQTNKLPRFVIQDIINAFHVAGHTHISYEAVDRTLRDRREDASAFNHLGTSLQLLATTSSTSQQQQRVGPPSTTNAAAVKDEIDEETEDEDDDEDEEQEGQDCQKWKSVDDEDEVEQLQAEDDENNPPTKRARGEVIAAASNHFPPAAEPSAMIEVLTSSPRHHVNTSNEGTGSVTKMTATTAAQLRSLNYCLHTCVPMKTPIPPRFLGDRKRALSTPYPDFSGLANFSYKATQDLTREYPEEFPDGTSCCMMCGDACWDKKKVDIIKPTSVSSAKRRYGRSSTGTASSDGAEDAMDDSYEVGHIPTQNKGVCNRCDTKVWIHKDSGTILKWCKACKNFVPWAAFGDKGSATKCVPCRDRQKQSYALKKAKKFETDGSAISGPSLFAPSAIKSLAASFQGNQLAN